MAKPLFPFTTEADANADGSITLTFDWHQFVQVCRGFANASHLFGDFFSTLAWRAISQMDSETRDCIWMILRRDLWDDIFYRHGGIGQRDFLCFMAALHRNNCGVASFRHSERIIVPVQVLAYRFDGEVRPHPANNLQSAVSANSFIPKEWLVGGIEYRGSVDPVIDLPDNLRACWDDVSVYSKSVDDIVAEVRRRHGKEA